MIGKTKIEPLTPLLRIANRAGNSGHMARVQVLRILAKRGILADARLGLVDGIDPDEVELCLSQDDKQEVIADLMKDPLVAGQIPSQISLEELGQFKLAAAQPGQLILF